MPRILLAVPLLLGGMFLPPAGEDLHRPAAAAVGMVHEGFSSKVVTIHRGQTLTFQNDSRFIHIIGPGRDGNIVAPTIEPVADLTLMEQNDTYATGQWNVPGTYFITCSVHPEMTTKVVVLP